MASHTKLLVRTWLLDRGCCYFRSPEMSDAEARSLIQAARGVIDKAQESHGIEEVPGTNGSAFVLARRSPDPNHPSRTAPGFRLISIPDRNAFFREAVDAELRSSPSFEGPDTVPENWIFFDPGATPREPGQEATHAWRPGFAPRLTCKILGRFALLSLVFLVLLALVFLVLLALAKFLRPGTMPIQDEPPPPSAVESPGNSYIETKEWDWDRKLIGNLVQQPWAKKILGEPRHQMAGYNEAPKNPIDRELLERFARLFQRPALNLQPSDQLAFQKLKPQDHPEVAFLARLLNKSPVPPPGDKSIMPAQAVRLLDELKNDLKKALDLNLDFDNEDGFEGLIKLALNYREFSTKWRTNTSRSDRRNGLPGAGAEVENPSLVEVRKILEDLYPR